MQSGNKGCCDVTSDASIRVIHFWGLFALKDAMEIGHWAQSCVTLEIFYILYISRAFYSIVGFILNEIQAQIIDGSDNNRKEKNYITVCSSEGGTKGGRILLPFDLFLRYQREGKRKRNESVKLGSIWRRRMSSARISNISVKRKTNWTGKCQQ